MKGIQFGPLILWGHFTATSSGVVMTTSEMHMLELLFLFSGRKKMLLAIIVVHADRKKLHFKNVMNNNTILCPVSLFHSVNPFFQRRPSNTSVAQVLQYLGTDRHCFNRQLFILTYHFTHDL